MNKLVDQYMDTLHDSQFEGPDPLELEIDVLRGRVAVLEDQVRQQAVNVLTLAEHIKALREAQSTSVPQSSIIMPDRFN